MSKVSIPETCENIATKTNEVSPCSSEKEASLCSNVLKRYLLHDGASTEMG